MALKFYVLYTDINIIFFKLQEILVTFHNQLSVGELTDIINWYKGVLVIKYLTVFQVCHWESYFIRFKENTKLCTVLDHVYFGFIFKKCCNIQQNLTTQYKIDK